MSRRIKFLLLAAMVLGLLCFARPKAAHAQVAVTTYYPATPVVTYYAERRGLFGRRLVFRPALSYAVPAVAAPVTTYYAPSAAVVAAPVTTYYAPSATVVASPVTTYYAPATTVVAPPVTTYYAPAPVTTFYSPIIGY